MDDHLTYESEQHLSGTQPDYAREKHRYKVEHPSRHVDERRIVLVERIAIRRTGRFRR